MSEKKSSGTGRTRNFATVVYPESAPENWREILDNLHIPCFISPLHDKDVNEKDNTPKKPHYHVLALYETVKTDEQARANFDKIGGVGLERINSVRGYSRYLCHLDNPEKHQYSVDDVIAVGGLDYIQSIGTAADKAKAIREMITWIEEEDITCWADLLSYASIHNSFWFDCLINSGAYVTKEYIKSRTWKLHKLEEK